MRIVGYQNMGAIVYYFKTLNPPAITAQIEEAENEMGLILPFELKEFYYQANGGHIPDNLVYTYDDLFTVAYVSIYDLGFLKSAYLSNKRADGYYETEDYCSNYLIPFCELGQNQLCIAFAGEDIGKIFWLGDPGDGFALYRLADSLADFLSMLKPDR